MQSTTPTQTNHRLQKELEKLFDQWKEETSRSQAIRLVDRINNPSTLQFVRLSRKPTEEEIFLRFAHDKIGKGNHVFAGVVMKLWQLHPDSLLEENEKDGISTEETAKRILDKIDLFFKDKEQKSLYSNPLIV